MPHIYKIVHNHYLKQNDPTTVTTYVAASDIENARKRFLERYTPINRYNKIYDIVCMDDGDVIME